MKNRKTKTKIKTSKPTKHNSERERHEQERTDWSTTSGEVHWRHQNMAFLPDLNL